ncbi:MAG: LD-carboxypeptidase [Bacteroidales bacterium]|jgi:muramoyltetrapeptide carboxypeptidase|nr:LD-carboxypeptidase [Bacteroidales bacterium]
MLFPKPLKYGDRIRIVSPAGKVQSEFVSGAAKYFEKQGFLVEIGKHALSEYHKFAGTDVQRHQDLQDAMNDNSVAAILCARGGYGSMRIVDKLDWTGMINKPKFLIGFSDITTLHAAAFQHGIVSVHGCMAKDFHAGDTVAIHSLEQILLQNTSSIQWNTHEFNRDGSVEAPLVGGNLSMLYALRGTPYDLDWSGKILFMEDLCEELYHVDRIMQNFRLGGKFNQLAGLVVGQFTDMTDPEFGFSAYDIIRESVKDFSFPIAFNAPIGHVKKNHSLLHAGNYAFSVNPDDVLLKSLNQNE